MKEELKVIGGAVVRLVVPAEVRKRVRLAVCCLRGGSVIYRWKVTGSLEPLSSPCVIVENHLDARGAEYAIRIPSHLIGWPAVDDGSEGLPHPLVTESHEAGPSA